MKTLKNTILGKIPVHWEIKNLGDCITTIIDHRGKTPQKMGGDWQKNGIRAISAKNIKNEKLVNEDLIRCVSQEIYEKWMKEDIKRGDCFLVSEGATLGENMYWDSNEKIVLSQRIFCIRSNENILDSAYLSAYLNTSICQKEIEARATGTTVLGLRQSEVRNLQIILPTLKEQKFIGKFYKDINKKIEINNEMNKTLEEMAQTLFKRWFIDFDFPNENGEPYRSSGGKMVDSELGEIPEGWEISDIYKISNVIYVAPFKSKQFNEDKKGFPLIRIRDLKTFNPQFFTEENHPKKTLINPGDLLVGMDAEFRATPWLGKIGVLNQRVCMFSPNKDTVGKYFLKMILEKPLSFFENSKVATTVIHLGKSDIDMIKIICPNDLLLEKFKELTEHIYQKKINNAQEIQSLTEIRDTLLPKLMSGDIEV